MPRQQVEFEFPDPDKEVPLEIEGAVGRETIKPANNKDARKATELEIEIEDDTPPKDRGRKASEPPQAVTDEELENYSEKVKNRIKHFNKGYHDERRAKETALREREALETYTKQLIEENKNLKGKTDESHNALLQSAKKQVEGELAIARRQYKEAYEAGESEAVLEAQTALNAAQIRIDKINNLKPRVVERAETPLQLNSSSVQPRLNAPQLQNPRDEKAETWREDNSWFGADDEMTAFALGLHNKLTKNGVNPQSDEYYEKINSRMRQVFPDQFDDGVEDEPASTRRKSSNVVAPATRSAAPKKIRLTQSQVAIAKRLGVSLADYAKQAVELSRKQ
jgi:uncharacterized protein (UPF0303 family)